MPTQTNFITPLHRPNPQGEWVPTPRVKTITATTPALAETAYNAFIDTLATPVDPDTPYSVPTVISAVPDGTDFTITASYISWAPE